MITVFSRSHWFSKAAQEASKQTQEAIGKAADKATTSIKEIGKKMETKWSLQKEAVLAEAVEQKNVPSSRRLRQVIMLASGKTIILNIYIHLYKYSANIPVEIYFLVFSFFHFFDFCLLFTLDIILCNYFEKQKQFQIWWFDFYLDLF